MSAVSPQNLFAMETTPTLRLKVAAYNIHGGIGSDRRFDLARVARVLKVAAPEVIALNEVYSYAGATPQYEALTEHLGPEWRAFFGKTIDKPRAEYGNAILTRLPVESTEQWQLDEWPRQERRGLIRVTVRKHDQPIHIFCTHMGLASTMREKNARQLIQILDQFDDAEQVLLGDFNEVPPAPGLELIAKSGYTDAWEMYGLGPGKTFPAKPTLRRLDYIWLTGGLAAESVYVGRFPEARIASDHRPVFASIVRAHPRDGKPEVRDLGGEVIRAENLEKVPSGGGPSWFKPLKNIRARGDAEGTGKVDVIGTEHLWRQKSEGELVFGEKRSKLAVGETGVTTAPQALLVSARVQTLAPGAGWKMSYGDLSVRVRHDRDAMPTLDLMHRDEVIESAEMWQMDGDPYVWNIYSMVIQPSGSVTILINGREVLSHAISEGSNAASTAGFRLSTQGRTGECEILADDLLVRTLDPGSISAVQRQLQRIPPKIIYAHGSRTPTRWWNNLW